MQPKVAIFDTFMSAENVQNITQAAKTLGTGRNKLYALLRNEKILMDNNLPYQRYIDNGDFVVKQVPIKMGEATIDKPQTYVTPKGITYLAKLLTKKAVAITSLS